MHLVSWYSSLTYNITDIIKHHIIRRQARPDIGVYIFYFIYIHVYVNVYCIPYTLLYIQYKSEPHWYSSGL